MFTRYWHNYIFFHNDACFTFSAFSFKCYQCVPKTRGVKKYTTEQCLKDQIIVSCTNRDPTDPTEYACVRMHSLSEDGDEYETRACYIKSICEEKKKQCEDKAKRKELKIKECTITCCVSDGDTPCNRGFAVSVNMMVMMIFIVSYTFMLF